MKTNKKGFTIVELVIVIAVIAILAAVFIPIFSNVVDKANKSAALSEVRNALTLYVAENAEQVGVRDLILKVTKDDKVNYYFVAKDNLTPVLIEENKPTASTTTSGYLTYDEKQYAPYTPTPEGWPSNIECFESPMQIGPGGGDSVGEGNEIEL